MSERMIEIQRARLGLPPMGAGVGSSSTQPTTMQGRQAAPGLMLTGQHNNHATNHRSHPQHHPHNTPHHHHHHHHATMMQQQQQQQQQHHHHQAVAAVRQTPQQQAAASALYQDEQMKVFLQRLQKRDDSHPLAEAGPTVPTALTRRMLQIQGVGYLDDTVAALASASADRFLATVLQQAVACRDQRVKGANMAREEARQRRKHQLLYQQDADDRKRRKMARKEAKLKANLAAIEAANELNNNNSNSNSAQDKGSASASSKKKKKKEENGETIVVPPKATGLEDLDGDSSDGSLDEEERYYEDCWGGSSSVPLDNEEEEDDESRYMLSLRDLEAPLKAWDISLTGKVGLGVIPLETVEEPPPDHDQQLQQQQQYQHHVAMDEEKLENGVDHGPPSPIKPRSPTKAVENGPRSRTATPAADRAQTPVNPSN